MSDPVSRDDLLVVVESLLESQLKAIRALRHGQRPAKTPRKSKSNTKIVEDILRSAGQPLPVAELIARAQRDHGVVLHRESIVSALSKKVLDGRIFCRTGRNVFGLLPPPGNAP